MQILLDECLPRDLRKLLPGHTVKTTTEQGWSGISNGKLLALAVQNNFEVFITVDQNLSVQNPAAGKQLIVVVLQATSNRLGDLQPLVSKIIDLVSKRPSVGIYFLKP